MQLRSGLGELDAVATRVVDDRAARFPGVVRRRLHLARPGFDRLAVRLVDVWHEHPERRGRGVVVPVVDGQEEEGIRPPRTELEGRNVLRVGSVEDVALEPH
jgi:hypothetical protein